MTAPRFGVWLPHHGFFATPRYPGDAPDASYRNSRDLALLAERSGFESLLIAQQTVSTRRQDADVLEPWTAAAGVAEATSSIEIVVAIKPFLYNPGVLAKMALGIDDISGGRVALNVVSGWFLPEMERLGLAGLDHDERYAYASDWLRVVRGLFRGETVEGSGRFAGINDLALWPRSVAPQGPTIYLGGESDPARDLAAEQTDVYFLNGRPLEQLVPIMEDVRRRRSSVLPPLRFALSAFVIARETAEEAQRELAFLRSLVDGETTRLVGADPATKMLQVEDAARPVGTNGGTNAGLVGSYEQVAERIGAFHDAGIELFMLQFQPIGEELTRFATHVMPRVADAPALAAHHGGNGR